MISVFVFALVTENMALTNVSVVPTSYYPLYDKMYEPVKQSNPLKGG